MHLCVTRFPKIARAKIATNKPFAYLLNFHFRQVLCTAQRTKYWNDDECWRKWMRIGSQFRSEISNSLSTLLLCETNAHTHTHLAWIVDPVPRCEQRTCFGSANISVVLRKLTENKYNWNVFSEKLASHLGRFSSCACVCVAVGLSIAFYASSSACEYRVSCICICSYLRGSQSYT